jgi:DUF4097 and DUF4098 domain-containing protein YvlB
MNRIWRLAPLAAFLVLGGCDFADLGDISRFQEDFHFNFDVQPNCRLSVETQNGSVEVTGWEKNSVEVTGAKFANSRQLLEAIQIDAHGDPGSVAIRAVIPPGHHFGGAGARLTIHVPRQTVLDRIHTSNAAIRVDGIEGDARLKTSNGSIHVNATKGRLETETSNSAIEVESHRGDVEANTSNGHIQVESEGGGLKAGTSNSSIEARLKDPDAAGPVRLSSSNGHLSLILDSGKVPDVRATTSNSSIELRIPSNAGARIDATTSNGSISTDFEMTLPAGTHSKTHLEGVIGGGGASVHLGTSNGSIKITKGL